MANALADVLDMMAEDRWFTRAWIMQERLCSSGLSSTGVWATCALGIQSELPGEVCLIGGDQLEDAQEVAYRLDHEDPKDDNKAPAKDSGDKPLEEPSEEKYTKEESLEAAKRLRAAIATFRSSYRLVNPATWRRSIADSVRSFYSPLQTTHLPGPLGCLYPSDKLAMLANTCHWEKRIDTREIDKRDWSFSLCIWMLAIANKDASFFCAEESCRTNGLVENAAWAPRASTKLESMYCGGLLDHVSMRLDQDGLHTEGWLCKAERFLELRELIPLIKEIDQNVPEREKSAWINYEFKSYYEEDTKTKLQEFFWSLLLRLSALGEDEIANLI